MKFCPNCGSSVVDEATFCPACGTGIAASAPQQNAAPNYNYNNDPNFGAYATNYGSYVPAPAPVRPVEDPTDHTKEFDAQDISDNKVICMLIYLAGYIGIFVALLMAKTSKYVAFHVRQALKIEVTSILFSLAYVICAIVIGLIAFIPVLGWLIAGVYVLLGVAAPVTLVVIRIMCLIQICKGQAKEPALINKLTFLK